MRSALCVLRCVCRAGTPPGSSRANARDIIHPMGPGAGHGHNLLGPQPTYLPETPEPAARLEKGEDPAAVVADHRKAPVNALGIRRIMFAVDDIDDTLERLRKRGAQLVGEVVRYKDAYRLCYIRGPEGLLIGLAEDLR